MPPTKSALPYAVVGAGIVFVWAGISNRSVIATMQDLIAGRKPAAKPLPSAGEGGGGGGGTSWITTPSGSLQEYAQNLLTIYGWAGQWPDLNSLEMGEAGWSPTAANPTTHALGIAQALNHGTSRTAGTLGNEYGGYGLTDAEARAANSGDGRAQIKWMLNYIRSRYGSPKKAYAMWLSRNPHWY
jgi:hypothetical protein